MQNTTPTWLTDWHNKTKTLKQRDLKEIGKKLKKANSQQITTIANAEHDKVFARIDCLQCANCCKSIPPIVTKSDSSRIAKYLGIKVAEFESSYVRYDEDDDRVMNQSPCPFLESDNACSIYDVRPKACREYPHTDTLDFHNLIDIHVKNIMVCPAADQIIESILISITGSKK